MCGGASVLRRVDNSEIRGACRILIHDTLGTIILSIVDQDDFQLILREPLVEHGVESLREVCQGVVHEDHHRYEWLILIRAAGHAASRACASWRSEEHTSELQSRGQLVCRLLLERKKWTYL